MSDTDTVEELSAKKLKKLEKNSDTRTLDPWERYRAIVDVYDAFFDMNEVADKKTRFALVIMGALNALNLILGTQKVFGDLTAGIRPLVGIYFGVYAVLSLFFFVQAIATLRPRVSVLPGGKDAATRLPAGLRFIGDIVTASDDEYYQRWTAIQVGELCRETARHVQVVARVTEAKFKALDRVYNGLTAMTALTAIMLTLLAYYRLMG